MREDSTHLGESSVIIWCFDNIFKRPCEEAKVQTLKIIDILFLSCSIFILVIIQPPKLIIKKMGDILLVFIKIRKHL